MKNKFFFTVAGLGVILVFLGFVPTTTPTASDFPSQVKVAFREVGNQLLLAEGDSTSLVLPILQEEKSYLLSFEETLALQPYDIVLLMEDIFGKAGLPNAYRVELLQCSSGEVAYSFDVKHPKENSIIPCLGRKLPKDCYSLKLQFIENTVTTYKQTNSVFQKPPSLLYLLLFVAAVPLSVLILKKKRPGAPFNTGEGLPLGSFTFYPAQYLLVRGEQQIALSKKECELLTLFIAAPNQTIPREELSKKVWEDHGVVVGRSLDTYISKLRKKLQADPTLQLTNVHGVGYKLEVVYG
ncbi:MAG: winged helix-turn-helix domain-containing protein [Flavobacteriaceae bacterium]